MAIDIPLSDIDFGDEEIHQVVEVLKAKWLSLGGVTGEFEKAFARFLNLKYALGVSSGTAALHLAHLALGIGPGDEVILPSLTFVATANAVVYVGAKPVFAEVTGSGDLNVSPADIATRITSRTKAIVLVHYGGYSCQMDAMLSLARRHGLFIIEDAAHAPGAEFAGQKVGTFGDVGCFSFFANKNLVTGEGGMAVTRREDLAGRIRLCRSHGMTTQTWDRHKGHAHTYDVVDLGYNYRIDEMRSALGLVQLGKLEDNNRRRGRIADLYRQVLAGIEGLEIPFGSHAQKSAHHLFVVLLPAGVNRDQVIKRLRDQGIQTSIHYPPVHLFSYYRQRFGYGHGHLPVTEEIARRQLTLPLHPLMTAEQVGRVAEALSEALRES